MADKSWVKDAEGWTANHFSLSDTSDDVPAFLEKLAARIRDLGEVEILNVVFGRFFNRDSEFETKVTVYFSREGAEEPVLRLVEDERIGAASDRPSEASP